MGIEGQAPKDDRDGSDAVPQGRVEAVQERVQVSVCMSAGTLVFDAGGDVGRTLSQRSVLEKRPRHEPLSKLCFYRLVREAWNRHRVYSFSYPFAMHPLNTCHADPCPKED